MFVNSTLSRNRLIALAAAGVIIVAGMILVATKASTLFASAEPEAGTISGASVVNDTGASGGKAVQFVAQKAPAPAPAPAPSPSSSGKLLQPYGLGFAPYVYVPWTGSVSEAQAGTGAKNYVAAFVLASGNSCTPAWDGNSSLGMDSARGNDIANDISRVRSAGGDVMISFGGAAGTELAAACGDAASLKQAYRKVIDKYRMTKVDFDIEGATATNTTANTRRADALLALQKELPQVKIWVTLQVDQGGLPASARAVVKQLHDKGVILAGVNIMVMDYGTGVTQMGQAAQQAAQSTHAQLKQVYSTSTDAEVWKSIGLTAMIGINDTRPETFTLANAREVRDFAAQKGVGMLSYWNAARDKACANNAALLSDSCSGVAQSPWQFAKTMTLTPSN